MVGQDTPALSGGKAVESVEVQTGRVSLWLIATLVGGTLILASFQTALLGLNPPGNSSLPIS